MSLDTVLNLLAVTGVIILMYFTFRNYRVGKANQEAIKHLPQALALQEVVEQARRVSGLLKEDAERLQQHKIVLAKNAELEKTVADLRYKLGTSDGKVVYMTDMQFRTNAILENQLGALNKNANTITEMHDTILRQQVLIEELTRAMPNAPREPQ